MHILLATTGYPPEHAGAGGRLHQMYRRLSAADPSLSWSVFTKSRDAKLSVIEGPRHIHSFERGGGEYPSFLEAVLEMAWTLRQLLKGLLDDVDLVHAAGWTWGTPLLALAARYRGIPFVRELTTIGDVGADSLGGRLIQWTNRQAHTIIAISPALSEGTRRSLSGAIPIWCRPNGIDTTRFRFPDSDMRAQRRLELCQWLPGLSADDVVVLHVGRIRPLKNQLFLAECIATLPSNFRLLLVGPSYRSDNEYLDYLRARLTEPDLAGRAYLLEGNIADVERFMQGSDIFALPSVNEGLGTVMIEALCCGLPVVASRLPGVTDWIVNHGNNGLLAPLEVDHFSVGLMQAAGLYFDRERIASDAIRRFDQASMDEGYRSLFCKYHNKWSDAV